MAYPNGQIPERLMVNLGSGVDQYGTWKHLLPPGTAARWNGMVADAKKLYGVTLCITPGWNAYRPLNIQKLYRTALGIWAAFPGRSSHGGEFNGRDCMAIDVQNWADIGWANFAALCAKWGFTTNFVTPEEKWHIGDFNPWAMPASLQEEDDMFTDADRELLRNATAGKGGVQFYERVKADGASDGEWMIVDPSFAPLTPGSLQDGYRVTTDINQARIWGRQVAGVSTRPVHLIRDLYIGQQAWARSRAAEWRASILAIVKEAVAGIPVATATPAAECKCPPAVAVDVNAIAAAVRAKFATDPLK